MLRRADNSNKKKEMIEQMKLMLHGEAYIIRGADNIEVTSDHGATNGGHD